MVDDFESGDQFEGEEAQKEKKLEEAGLKKYNEINEP